jgi:hypothetical protein
MNIAKKFQQVLEYLYRPENCAYLPEQVTFGLFLVAMIVLGAISWFLEKCWDTIASLLF